MTEYSEFSILIQDFETKITINQGEIKLLNPKNAKKMMSYFKVKITNLKYLNKHAQFSLN